MRGLAVPPQYLDKIGLGLDDHSVSVRCLIGLGGESQARVIGDLCANATFYPVHRATLGGGTKTNMAQPTASK